MERRTRNITALGLLTVVTTVLFIWGMYYLLGNPVLQGGLDLVISLENGAGLKRGDRVYLSGVDVGLVQSVNIDESGGVVVDVRVRGDLALPTDTHAAVMGDVFGAHTVELWPGASMLRLAENDTITGGAVPQITELAADIGDRARTVLSAVDSLISPAAVQGVHETAAVLPSSATELRAALEQLRLAASALRRTAEEVADARTGEAVAGAIAEVEQSAQAITEATRTVEQSLGRSLDSFANVMAKIDDGQGTLGRLVNDSSLYMEFEQALREMRLLAGDIRERPGRYINLRIF